MSKLAFLILLLGECLTTLAQGNYEIQVYGADTVSPGSTMLELHSNFTPNGQRNLIDSVYPTFHQEHETIEITQGITDWSEVGFYIFTSEQNGHGMQWVGDHIRPRVRVPDSWHWPIGFSISTEIGYQRPIYSPDTWTWEIRPIIDKAIDRWYFAVNPALERTWHGPDARRGLGFAPAAKVSYDFTQKISGGIEYYADYGRFFAWDSLHQQQQQFFIVADLNVSPKWEFNFGVGLGVTASTDRLIIKGIVGRRFSWRRKPEID
jgi:hypothetical protein